MALLNVEDLKELEDDVKNVMVAVNEWDLLSDAEQLQIVGPIFKNRPTLFRFTYGDRSSLRAAVYICRAAIGKKGLVTELPTSRAQGRKRKSSSDLSDIVRPANRDLRPQLQQRLHGSYSTPGNPSDYNRAPQCDNQTPTEIADQQVQQQLQDQHQLQPQVQQQLQDQHQLQPQVLTTSQEQQEQRLQQDNEEQQEHQEQRLLQDNEEQRLQQEQQEHQEQRLQQEHEERLQQEQQEQRMQHEHDKQRLQKEQQEQRLQQERQERRKLRGRCHLQLNSHRL